MSQGHVVVVTGASAGVGRAVVREFARRGARVGLVARDAERLREAAREVEALGGEALVLPCDVSDSQAVEAAAEATERRWGALDVWVNCAMVTVFAPVMETQPDEFRRVMEVTFLGYVHGTQAALRRMRPRDRGTVVQVGSALAFRGIPLQAAYCSAKHAIVGFTESLRSELLHDKSRVHLTVVDLPGMNTPQFDWSRSRMPRQAQPVPPIFQPEVAARAVVWAARHRRRSIRVGMPTVETILGNRLAPWLLDRYLARVGYARQMTRAPRRQRADNLFSPVPGDPGAHGRFDSRARRHSFQTWANLHRGWLAGLAAVGVALAFSSPWPPRSAGRPRA
ncbi:SDR family oxidoreductase [Myxococcus stipitatus]|uniref:SDR family oxidoreductase n=1 Tax=Myxococcus stipitatus TaxID=83455 RepID=UPI001F42E3AD|nr:SDR family oxidoreductase [Myxococcus stipitatus]MCE9670213.1 SDR family oxidoreductase [Myxococcus stipitatus]